MPPLLKLYPRVYHFVFLGSDCFDALVFVNNFFSTVINTGCGEIENFNFSRDVCRKRIVGGQDSSKGAYPWHVLLMKDGRLACGGSLLNERWVLTGESITDPSR